MIFHLPSSPKCLRYFIDPTFPLPHMTEIRFHPVVKYIVWFHDDRNNFTLLNLGWKEYLIFIYNIILITFRRFIIFIDSFSRIFYTRVGWYLLYYIYQPKWLNAFIMKTALPIKKNKKLFKGMDGMVVIVICGLPGTCLCYHLRHVSGM